MNSAKLMPQHLVNEKDFNFINIRINFMKKCNKMKEFGIKKEGLPPLFFAKRISCWILF